MLRVFCWLKSGQTLTAVTGCGHPPVALHLQDASQAAPGPRRRRRLRFKTKAGYGGLEHVFLCFFHILGMVNPTDSYFSEGDTSGMFWANFITTSRIDRNP